VVRYHVGGILSALTVLKEHWGPVGRDLAAAGWVWDDVCDRLPLDQFIAFVVYAPPSTAVFHVKHDGWDANTHKITDLIQWVKMLISLNTGDPQKAYDELGPESRPGSKSVEPPKPMTIGEYMTKVPERFGGD
jgi:hypothetical protein